MRPLTRLLLAASSVLALLGGAAVAVHADEGPGSSPTPPSKPGDPFNGATLPPGDTFVVTPSDGATQLGDPVDPEVVQSLADADADGTPDAAISASPTAGGTDVPDADGTPGTGSGEVVDPGDAAAPGADDDGSSGPAWWVFLVGLAALAALGGAAWRFRRQRAEDAPGP